MFAKFPKFTISENDRVTCCCLLQHNVSCGRGQNHQVYTRGFSEEIAPAKNNFQIAKKEV